ncbi:hypothetical protein LB505_011546 [Fusarium chuoi]|nr:hypothetical protein LB505_011546 [Fusarium chuoi]
MQSMPPRSSPSASSDHHVTTAGSSLASIRKSQPTHLHNVDIYIWEISYQSAMNFQRDFSSLFVTSAPSPFNIDSGTSPQPQQPHQSPAEDVDQHRPVSPTTPATIDTELSISPPGDVLPAHSRGNRRALCPECRAYTSKRSFNMKRHRKACNKKAATGRAKATESIRSRVSGATPF